MENPYNKIFPIGKRFKISLRFLAIRFMNILLQVFMFLIQILILIPMVFRIKFFMDYMKILPKTFYMHNLDDKE